MPEIKNYRDFYFFEQYPELKNEYSNISLPLDWSRKVFHFTDYKATKTFTTKKYSILNIGNIEYLWINGLNFDKTSNA